MCRCVYIFFHSLPNQFVRRGHCVSCRGVFIGTVPYILFFCSSEGFRTLYPGTLFHWALNKAKYRVSLRDRFPYHGYVRAYSSTRVMHLQDIERHFNKQATWIKGDEPERFEEMFEI